MVNLWFGQSIMIVFLSGTHYCALQHTMARTSPASFRKEVAHIRTIPTHIESQMQPDDYRRIPDATKPR